MQTLTNLNNLLSLLQQNAAKIGITVAGLLIAVYTMVIMMSNDNSPAGRVERWAQLKKVFVGAAIIAATGALIQFATGLGGML
jgi:hypothetical protein